MKVSILLATYNGCDFLKEQLDSLLSQSRLPDEVVAIDDGSTDRTIDILKAYCPSFSDGRGLSIIVNDANLGWKDNFRRGLSYCNGDLVFFCDQDDIWLPNKIEVYERIFASRPDIDVLSSPYMRFSGEYQIQSMRDEFKRCSIPRTIGECRAPHGAGCTMAVRASYANRVSPFYPANMAHDYFFRQIALLEGCYAVMDDSSIYRRIHGGNASEKKRNLSDSITNCDESRLLAEAVVEYGKATGAITPGTIRLAERVSSAYESRIDYLAGRKSVTAAMKAVLLYPSMYSRARNFFGDVALRHGWLSR